MWLASELRRSTCGYANFLTGKPRSLSLSLSTKRDCERSQKTDQDVGGMTDDTEDEKSR